jgi:hypothetical protein
VLDALSTLLEIEEVPFGAIESEQLARGYPWLSEDEWIPQLAAVLALQRKAGRERFLVVATTEDVRQLRGVVAAVAAERTLVVCLSAPADLVAERIAEREPDSWPGKGRLIEHARVLAGQIPTIADIDLVISTVGRAAIDVAAEVRKALSEHAIVPGRPSSPRLTARLKLTAAVAAPDGAIGYVVINEGRLPVLLGEAYELDRFVDGGWESVPLPWLFRLWGRRLETGGRLELSARIPDGVQPGRYRLRKRLRVDTDPFPGQDHGAIEAKPIVLSAEFEVTSS